MRMGEKRLLLVTGLPGVGKTTIADIIGEGMQAPVIHIDDFKKAVVPANQISSQIDPPGVRMRYYKPAFEVAFKHFDNGHRAVIMEEVFPFHELRAAIERGCRRQKVKTLWIKVHTPYIAVERRLHETARPGHALTTEETLALHKAFVRQYDPFEVGTPNYLKICTMTHQTYYSIINRVIIKMSMIFR